MASIPEVQPVETTVAGPCVWNREASSLARLLGIRASYRYGEARFASSCASPAPRGSKSHSAAICDRNPVGLNNVILPVAVRPAVMVCQNVLRLLPPGATTPIPVTAILRVNMFNSLSSVGYRNANSCRDAVRKRSVRNNVENLFGVDVAQFGSGSQWAQVKHDKYFLAALVHQSVFDVNRNQQGLALV